MDKISSSEYMDTYRLEYGLILEVRKFRYLKGSVWGLDSKVAKRLSGVKDGYILKQDFEYRGTNYERGTVFINCNLVEIIDDPKEYRFEIRASGGTITKHGEAMTSLLNNINEVIRAYMA